MDYRTLTHETPQHVHDCMGPGGCVFLGRYGLMDVWTHPDEEDGEPSLILRESSEMAEYGSFPLRTARRVADGAMTGGWYQALLLYDALVTRSSLMPEMAEIAFTSVEEEEEQLTHHTVEGHRLVCAVGDGEFEVRDAHGNALLRVVGRPGDNSFATVIQGDHVLPEITASLTLGTRRSCLLFAALMAEELQHAGF